MVAAIQSMAVNKSGGDASAFISSEKDNAAAPRRPRTKEITSRYLSYTSSSSSTSPSTSSSSSSSSSLSSSRRFASPVLSRPSTALQRRSQSVDRTRPSAIPLPLPNSTASAAARALCTTTRSLSVSFQGKSFFYQTSKAKVTPPSPSPSPLANTRKTTPEGRRPATPSRGTRNHNAASNVQSENSRPLDLQRCWPSAKPHPSNSLVRSLDCSLEKDLILGAARLIHHSKFHDYSTSRASFDSSTDLSVSSDTDSASSGSNSGTQNLVVLPKSKSAPREISLPARFWQESNGLPGKLWQPGTPIQSPTSRSPAPGRLSSMKKHLVNNPLFSPCTASSVKGPSKPAFPCKLVGSPTRGVAAGSSAPTGQMTNAPSITSFGADLRRSKKGEKRIEEAHLFRLYDNKHVQWRWVNAKANAAFSVQRLTAEKNLYNEWITILGLRDSVSIKRLRLHLLTQNLKITSILKGQMNYLEEWSLMDREHTTSLSGAIEALKANTVHLPVVGGAKAVMQEVKQAVGSSVDVAQAMGSPIFALLSKVNKTSSLVSELAKVVAQEKALLNQLRDLLSTVAVLQVKQCSICGHLIQLSREPCQLQMYSRLAVSDY